MRGLRLGLVAAVATVAAGGIADRAPVARADTAEPAKLAVIFFENKDYDSANGQPDTEYVVGSPNAPYINGFLLNPADAQGAWVPEPNDAAGNTACNFVKGESQGTGTTACASGFFQSRRTTVGGTTSFRKGGSASEYTWDVVGTDANISDAHFPCGRFVENDVDLLHCDVGFAPTSPNHGIQGYSPDAVCTNDPVTHECTGADTYNVFDYADAHGIGYTVYAEDYVGDATTCSTASFSDDHKGSDFYARKHNPFLLTWDVSPDALPYNLAHGDASDVTPDRPTDAACLAHVRDFPGNTPNADTSPITNFPGSERFHELTLISPSMCHSGHNSNSAGTNKAGYPLCGAPSRGCGPNESCGGIQGFDRWLELNLPGIRQDVGQDGTVLVISDENQTNDDAGTTAPTFAMALPGTDATGTPGVLSACQSSSPCYDASSIYDQGSVAKALIEFAGGGCANFDNRVTYNAFTTASTTCSAATALPVAVQSQGIRPGDGTSTRQTTVASRR
jgi:hypothetical protein